MDAIHVDASLRRRTKSFDDNSDRDKPIEMRKGKRKGRGGTAGGILNAVHMGVGSATGRKNYSLAPCHHLFVSLFVIFLFWRIHIWAAHRLLGKGA
jgi:hypothetical protein